MPTDAGGDTFHDNCESVIFLQVDPFLALYLENVVQVCALGELGHPSSCPLMLFALKSVLLEISFPWVNITKLNQLHILY